MPEVTFYVLSAKTLNERYLFVCKLVEKIFRSGIGCYLLTEDKQQSRYLDDLLWTFRPGSFIPHECFTGELPTLKHVSLIGETEPPSDWRHTLINLSTHCPIDMESVGRILEVLVQEPTVLEPGRQRYRHYQQAGLAITTHTL